jgi:hypothetical protein
VHTFSVEFHDWKDLRQPQNARIRGENRSTGIRVFSHRGLAILGIDMNGRKNRRMKDDACKRQDQKML